MTCDRCEESRAAGHSFCMHCGAPLACPRCMESREQGCVFCPSCGRRLVETHPKRSPTTREILRNIVLCVVPVLVFLLVAEAVALVVGFADVLEWAGKSTVEVLVLIPRLEVAAYLSGLGLQLYWVAVFAAIYPRFGFSSRTAHVYGSPEDVRPLLLKVMDLHGYRLEKDGGDSLTFVKRSVISRLLKMWEDRITVSFDVAGLRLEGISKDLVRLVSGLEASQREDV